jgi:hypothetical protein
MLRCKATWPSPTIRRLRRCRSDLLTHAIDHARLSHYIRRARRESALAYYNLRRKRSAELGRARKR